MNTTANEAIENISIIKSTMEESKISYKGLYKLCIVFGICNTALTLTSFLAMVFIVNNVFGRGSYFPAISTSFIRIASLVVPLIAYLIICKNEKNYNNRYYLSIIDTWAVISIILPIFKILVSVIQYGMINSNLLPRLDSMYGYLSQVGDLSAAILFLMIIIIYSNMLKKPYIKLIGLIILFVQMLLLMIESSYQAAGMPLSGGVPIPGSESFMTFSSLFSFIVFGIGYIIIGILIKKKVSLS